MLLKNQGQIRSCDRLEVGRNSALSRSLIILWSSIILNWHFPKICFSQTTRLWENASIHVPDLLPNRINFELGSHFSTTCMKVSLLMRKYIGASHVGGTHMDDSSSACDNTHRNKRNRLENGGSAWQRTRRDARRSIANSPSD